MSNLKSSSKKVLVIGGDGFCGWATSLHLADKGYKVTIVDNFSRRIIDKELRVQSLTPILSMKDRLAAWKEIAGQDKAIDFVEMDVAKEYDNLVELLKKGKFDSIVHFAEQRAAPYSMKNAKTAAYTIQNNTMATTNILLALAFNQFENVPHVIHLGTMGVYGYEGGLHIREGYLSVTATNPDKTQVELEIPYPGKAGSIYHNTKVTDHEWFKLFAKIYGIRSTDLHQGIVWGTQTKQTALDERLINRFDYDGDYGTVLNRFIMQAAIGHPLTVHGTSGGQTRAFINIQDTVKCIEIAIKNPPKTGDRPKVFNQVTETHRVIDLANLISTLKGVAITFQENPRKELDANELLVKHDQFTELGLHPITLSPEKIEEEYALAIKYMDRVDKSKIVAHSTWNPFASETKVKA